MPSFSLPRLAVAAALSLAPLTVLAQSAPPPEVNVLAGDNVAIHGTDPVAYFVEGRSRAGRADLAVTHASATWRFANAANRDRFIADPARYMPQYGGYCAYGAARGYLVKIDPDAWSIKDGKLYLNYDLAVQETWRENPADYIARADGNWPALAAAAATAAR